MLLRLPDANKDSRLGRACDPRVEGQRRQGELGPTWLAPEFKLCTAGAGEITVLRPQPTAASTRGSRCLIADPRAKYKDCSPPVEQRCKFHSIYAIGEERL